MTKSQCNLESAVMMSSAIPSAKYSCSEFPLIFWKARTAIDGLSGNDSEGHGQTRLAQPLEQEGMILGTKPWWTCPDVEVEICRR